MKMIVVDLQNCYIRDWYKSASFSTASAQNSHIRMIHEYLQLKVQMRLTSVVHSLFLFVSHFLRGSIKSGIKISKLSEPPTLRLLAVVLCGKKMEAALQESIIAMESFLSIKSNWQQLWRTAVDKIIHQGNITYWHALAKQKCLYQRRGNY